MENVKNSEKTNKQIEALKEIAKVNNVSEIIATEESVKNIYHYSMTHYLMLVMIAKSKKCWKK